MAFEVDVDEQVGDLLEVANNLLIPRTLARRLFAALDTAQCAGARERMAQVFAVAPRLTASWTLARTASCSPG